MIGNAGCPWRKAYEEKALGKKVKIPDKNDDTFSAWRNNKAAIKEIEHVFDKCASEELLSMTT